MECDRNAIATEALEDVAYLSRSANRVTILRALSDEARSRGELAEATDVSRTTLDRIVNELEARGWAARRPDGNYGATPTGHHLMAQFTPFLESVRALRTLGDAVSWLPEDLSIGLEHFADATVRRPPQDDPMATTDYFVDLLREAETMRLLTHLAPPGRLSRAVESAVVDGDLRATFVVSAETSDYLREQPDRRERWGTIAAAGADLYRYEGEIPCNLFCFDGTVLIKKSGPGPFHESYGIPIESDDDRVLEWARDLIEQYRTDADRVEPAAFAAAPTEGPVDLGNPSG